MKRENELATVNQDEGGLGVKVATAREGRA
jgi:hypothetical protein